jgi:hypothetical protein
MIGLREEGGRIKVEENETREHGGGEVEAEKDEEDEGAWRGMR